MSVESAAYQGPDGAVTEFIHFRDELIGDQAATTSSMHRVVTNGLTAFTGIPVEKVRIVSGESITRLASRQATPQDDPVKLGQPWIRGEIVPLALTGEQRGRIAGMVTQVALSKYSILDPTQKEFLANAAVSSLPLLSASTREAYVAGLQQVSQEQ